MHPQSTLLTCLVDGCDRIVKARQLCKMHYQSWGRQGLALPDRKRITPLRSFDERFWEKVNKNGPVPEHRPDIGPCWIWTAQHDDWGYGKFSINNRSTRATHVVYTLVNGPIPDDLWVLHKCDNPPCVRPDHLFLGTHQDNMDDMLIKGRRQAKLTLENVEEIRAIYARGGWDQQALAVQYGVSVSTISRAISGDSWGRRK